MENWRILKRIGLPLLYSSLVLAVAPQTMAAYVVEGTGVWTVMQELADSGPDPSHDFDGDLLTTREEMLAGTLYDNPDSDNDLLLDGFEVKYQFDPLGTDESEGDPDEDFVLNLEEQAFGTDPRDPDTDHDDLLDRFEIDYADFLDPLNAEDSSLDHDADGLTLLEEQAAGSDPRFFDADEDLDNVRDADIYDAEGNLIVAGDNCPLVENPDQADTDDDGIGDACDSMMFDAGTDLDGDGVADSADNCPDWPNPEQTNSTVDADGNPLEDNIGDACQCGDIDGNGTVEGNDVNVLANHLYDMQNAVWPSAQSMPLSALELCDTNGDSICSWNDLMTLYAHLLDPAADSDFQARCPTVKQVTDRALARIGYGADQWAVDRVRSLLVSDSAAVATDGYAGLDKYISEQLDPTGLLDPEYTKELRAYSVDGQGYPDTITLANYVTIGKTIAQKKIDYCSGVNCVGPVLEGNKRPFYNNREVKMVKNFSTYHQLDAVLSDFWFNHFNVVYSKSQSRWSIAQYEDLIRDNMHLTFEDLLLATAQSPAMLTYLDLHGSIANTSNENYARELMELHTVGLSRDSGDSFGHMDIIQVTRILTGWRHNSNLVFEFLPGNTVQHDYGDGKTVVMGDHSNEDDAVVWNFGYTDETPNTFCNEVEAVQGLNEGTVLMCLLARHERTADNVSVKLIKRFLGETALEELNSGDTLNGALAGMKSVWASSYGDLDAVLGKLLVNENNAFKRSLFYQGSKVKRPTVFTASLVRALGRDSGGSSSILNASYGNAYKSFQGLVQDIANNGEAMYEFGPPTGYPEESAGWLGTSSLLNRFNDVTRLINGSDPVDIDALREKLNLDAGYGPDDSPSLEEDGLLVSDVTSGLGVSLSPATRDHIVTFVRADTNVPTLNSRVKRAAMAVLLTPEFNSH